MPLKSKKRMLMLLLFFSLILMINQLIIPHFVIAGVFFFSSTAAIMINILFIALISLLIYMLFKSHTLSAAKGIAIFSILGLNSSANLLFALIIREETASFIESLYALSAVFEGYIINQVLILGTSALIISYILRHRRDLKK